MCGKTLYLQRSGIYQWGCVLRSENEYNRQILKFVMRRKFDINVD